MPSFPRNDDAGCGDDDETQASNNVGCGEHVRNEGEGRSTWFSLKGNQKLHICKLRRASLVGENASGRMIDGYGRHIKKLRGTLGCPRITVHSDTAFPQSVPQSMFVLCPTWG